MMKHKMFTALSLVAALAYTLPTFANKIVNEIKLEKTPAYMTISPSDGAVFISDKDSNVTNLFLQKGNQKLDFSSIAQVNIANLNWIAGINKLQIQYDGWWTLYRYNPEEYQYPLMTAYYKSPISILEEKFAGTPYKIQKTLSATIDNHHFGFILVSAIPNKKEYSQDEIKDVYIYRYDLETGKNLKRIFSNSEIGLDHHILHTTDFIYNDKKNQLTFVSTKPSPLGSYEESYQYGWLGVNNLQLNNEGDVVGGGSVSEKGNWDARMYRLKLVLDSKKQILYFIFKDTNLALYTLDINKDTFPLEATIPVQAKFTDLGIDPVTGNIYLTENKTLHALSKDKANIWHHQHFPLPKGNHLIDFDSKRKMTYILSPQAKRLLVMENTPF